VTATDHEDSVFFPDEPAHESEDVTAGDLDEGGSDDDAYDESEFVPRKPWRVTGLTVILAVCVLIGGGFLGGVLTQKHHDRGLAGGTGAAALRTAFAGRTGGFGGGTGGFGGGAAGAGAAGGTGTAAGAGSATGGSTTATAVPAVIGTVSALTPTAASVTNLGGTKVAVTLSKTTKVTAAYGTVLKIGDSVSVYGTKASTGTVAATSVTVS
jgi:hypothetical protein